MESNSLDNGLDIRTFQITLFNQRLVNIMGGAAMAVLPMYCVYCVILNNITSFKFNLIDLFKKFENIMLSPASGGARFAARSAKIIRFARHGCANRPFFHIVVMEVRRGQHQPVIEQLGTYDPLPNQFEEKLVSLNLERIRYWIGKGADTSVPVAELLGLAGFLPIHPRTYMTAWRNRKAEEEKKNAVVEENTATEKTLPG